MMSCQGKAPVYILHRCAILLFAFRLKEQELNPAIPKTQKQTEVCNCGSQAETHLLV